MMNFVAVSTSARAAACAVYAEELENERLWAERVDRIYEGLQYYSLHFAPHWFTASTREEMFDVVVTPDNADALEAEIAEREEREERQAEEERALLRRLEVELAENPNDGDLWSFYSDVHKDVYGFRPRW